jgi:flagellar hook assembly protein FlgD
MPTDNHVRLSAYNVQGQEVDVIFEGAQSVGQHSYTWNAASLPSGVYYIRLQAGDMITSQKALLVK